MTTRARTLPKRAALHTDFAHDFVERRFGKTIASEIYAALPKFKRGPRKGLVKGYIHWLKVEIGGWFHDPYSGRGRVVYPGTQEVQLRTDTDGRQIIYDGQFSDAQDTDARVAFVQRAITEAFAC